MSVAAADSANWLHRLDVTGPAVSSFSVIQSLVMTLVGAFSLWQGCRWHESWWLLAVLVLNLHYCRKCKYEVCPGRECDYRCRTHQS